MQRTPRPVMDAREVFATCCRNISDADRKGRLSPNIDKIERASADYANAGLNGNLDTFVASNYEPLGTATTDDFKWLYRNRLVRSSEGRTFYRSLRDGNNERCALCNVRSATTLDHHLPESVFPVLIVTPDNLLPACATCNHTKLANTTPTLNTYFDDLGPGMWLQARIIEGSPYIPEYFIDPQPSWSSGIISRAHAHFEMFGLKKLYAAQANRFLAGMRGMYTNLHETLGANGVRDHLQRSAESFALVESNGWERAILTAGAASDWFCDEGFRY